MHFLSPPSTLHVRNIVPPFYALCAQKSANMADHVCLSLRLPPPFELQISHVPHISVDKYTHRL